MSRQFMKTWSRVSVVWAGVVYVLIALSRITR